MVFPTLALREVKFNNQETSSCSQGWLFRGGDGAIDLRRLHIHLLLRHWTLPRSRSLHNILSRSRQLYDLLFVGSIRGFQVFFQLSSVLTRPKAFCLRVSGEGMKSFFLGLGGCQSTVMRFYFLQLNRVDFNNISAGHIGHQLQRRGLYSFSPHRYAAIEHELKC